MGEPKRASRGVATAYRIVDAPVLRLRRRWSTASAPQADERVAVAPSGAS